MKKFPKGQLSLMIFIDGDNQPVFDVPLLSKSPSASEVKQLAPMGFNSLAELQPKKRTKKTSQSS